jgi:hypothetical protein
MDLGSVDFWKKRTSSEVVFSKTLPFIQDFNKQYKSKGLVRLPNRSLLEGMHIEEIIPQYVEVLPNIEGK